jgi:formylglycine-generating enzyme required for sulfatase activity
LGELALILGLKHRPVSASSPVSAPSAAGLQRPAGRRTVFQQRARAKLLAFAVVAAGGWIAPPAPAAQPSSAEPGTVVVPAGDFWMGRTRLWLMDEIGWQIRDRLDDRPVHRVTLDAFSIDTHEATNADYVAFVKATGADAPYHWGGAEPPAAKATLPVYNVSWHDAVAYCTWRGKRLPTEAEWEKAARGGVADLDFPWGNDYETEAPEPETPPTATASATGEPARTPAPAPQAGPGAGTGKPAPPERLKHAHSASASGPRPVGSFAPNALGLYDVSGNVWEWVSDWYDLYYYGVSPIANPKGPSNGRYKVIRGGSWSDDEPRLGTVYFRNYTAPEERTPTIGIRCAR